MDNSHTGEYVSHMDMRAVEPPTRYPGSQTVRWLAEAAQAKKSPGVWFELTTRSTENSAWCFTRHVNVAKKVAFAPAGSFEACTRNRTVYIRYVGSDRG